MSVAINTCIQGDCREVMRAWPDSFADACITDPPYGDTSLAWDVAVDGWVEQVARVLRPNGSVWVFGSMRFIATIFPQMQAAGFRYSQDIVWSKQNGTGFHTDRFRRVHEHAVMFYRGDWASVYHDTQYTQDATAKTARRKTRPAHTGNIARGHYVSLDGGPRLMRSVIEVPNEHGTALHPTQKPLGIIAPLINYSVPPGGLVIDPFMGSGSVGIAANLLGRNWLGVEINPEYMAAQATRTRQGGLQFSKGANHG